MTILPLLLLLLLTVSPLGAAPSPPRPATGIGVLIPPPGVVTLTLHQAPGRGVIGEVPPGTLTHLAPFLGKSSQPLLPVARKQGAWFSLYLDETEREGWIRGGQGWQFVPWDEWLVGKQATLIRGIPTPLATFEPSPPIAPPSRLPRDATLRIIGIDGDRAFVLLGDGRSGWIRWRDRDGRFTLTLTPP